MAKRTFLVSIDVVTQGMSVTELASKLRVAVSASSHSRGDPHPSGKAWDATVLRLESNVDKARPLDEHLEHLFSIVENPLLRGKAGLPEDCRATLNIGVFFETAMSGIDVPARFLSYLAVQDMDLSISAYPCAAEDPIAPEP